MLSRSPGFILINGIRAEAANVGVSAYQSLLPNYADERQDAFYAIADIQFRRWKRYQLVWEIKEKRVGRLQGEWGRLWSLFYECVAAYGYGPFVCRS